MLNSLGWVTQLKKIYFCKNYIFGTQFSEKVHLSRGISGGSPKSLQITKKID